MAKSDLIDAEGVVTDVLPSGVFRVKPDTGDQHVIAHLGGKMRQYRIRVVLGDRVTVQVSPYDLTRGRISFRHK